MRKLKTLLLFCLKEISKKKTKNKSNVNFMLTKTSAFKHKHLFVHALEILNDRGHQTTNLMVSARRLAIELSAIALKKTF